MSVSLTSYVGICIYVRDRRIYYSSQLQSRHIFSYSYRTLRKFDLARNATRWTEMDRSTINKEISPNSEVHNDSRSSLMPLTIDRDALESQLVNADPGYLESEMLSEIHSCLSQIINDRDRLQTELKYADSTILELDAQNRELHRLLKPAQDALRSANDKQPTQIHPRDLDLSHRAKWIDGTWLSCGKTTPLLAGAESFWQRGKPQQALTLLTPILREETLKPGHRINPGLLCSAILRCNGDLKGALNHAQESLRIANETEQRQLAGKAQFHRGLCYLYLDRFADARWCFVLASHTEGHAAIIKEYLAMTVRKLSKLAKDDARAQFSL